MSDPIDFSTAASKLFGGKPDAPATPATTEAEPTTLRDAAARIYGESERAPEPPEVRDPAGVSLFGDKAAWDRAISEQYGVDLPQAKQLAAVGLAATSPDPAAERAAIGQSGCSPRRFAELVAAGRRVAGGGR